MDEEAGDLEEEELPQVAEYSRKHLDERARDKNHPPLSNEDLEKKKTIGKSEVNLSKAVRVKNHESRK